MKTAVRPLPPDPIAVRPRFLPPGPDSDFGACSDIPDAVRHGMRVLVVEDDPVQSLILMLFLERFGIDAHLVTDGQQAVTAVQSGAFTLVLMDYLLPALDGVEATLAIRRWEAATRRRPLPIVAVTASCMKEECQRYIDAGMDRVLHKPFSAREFGELVREYLLADQERRVACN